jgi:hypothetical protein
MPWPVHPNGLLGAQGGDNDAYQISRSLRFNSADSAYLNRTNSASPTNAIKYTISVWAKRGSIGSVQNITMSTVKFIPNIELAQKYKTIQLKPRKYDDQFLKYSNRDSILPYFKIKFYNQNVSHE